MSCLVLFCYWGRELILVLFVRLFHLVLSVSSSFLCLGWAVACDCGTPWTFLLPFLHTAIVVFVPCGDPRKSPRTFIYRCYYFKCQGLHFTITFRIPLPPDTIYTSLKVRYLPVFVSRL